MASGRQTTNHAQNHYRQVSQRFPVAFDMCKSGIHVGSTSSKDCHCRTCYLNLETFKLRELHLSFITHIGSSIHPPTNTHWIPGLTHKTYMSLKKSIRLECDRFVTTCWHISQCYQFL